MNEFVTTKDIMEIMRCSESKASAYKKKVHEETVKRGYYVLNNRTCLRSILYDMFIPQAGSKKGVKK